MASAAGHHGTTQGCLRALDRLANGGSGQKRGRYWLAVPLFWRWPQRGSGRIRFWLVE